LLERVREAALGQRRRFRAEIATTRHSRRDAGSVFHVARIRGGFDAGANSFN